MFATAALGKKDFAALGKILCQKKPEIAQELISTHLTEPAPPETDFTKIPVLFLQFCRIQGIDPEKYRGPLFKSSKIDTRRLFVAVIIRLYHPRTRRLPAHISTAIKQDHSATRRMIQQVEFMYDKLEEFRSQVDGIVKIMGGANE